MNETLQKGEKHDMVYCDAPRPSLAAFMLLVFQKMANEAARRLPETARETRLGWYYGSDTWHSGNRRRGMYVHQICTSGSKKWIGATHVFSPAACACTAQI
jgi:hypothetical protein